MSDSSGTGRNDSIVVRGARVHNLKNIDVEIPHNALTVVSGVSGSGKSSLAFDTVYAEGQRRYVESLSAYARQFLERIEKPDVDHMEGLAPAIAIRQKNQTRNPRSTVATATEIFDYLRLLFARCGTVHCLACGNIVRRHTVDDAAEGVLALPTGTRLYALFPVQRVEVIVPPLSGTEPLPGPGQAAAKKTVAKKVAKVVTKKAAADETPALSDALKERLADLRGRGYNRLYQDGKVVEFSTPESLLEIDFSRAVYVLCDRLSVSADQRARIVDAAEAGFRESGEILFEIVPRGDEAIANPPKRLRFSPAFECTHCHLPAREPEPILFSFNSPFGACPRCQGFGNTLDFDLDLIFPDKARTLEQGAVEPWTRPKYRPFHGEMKRAAKVAKVPMDVPWMDLTAEQQTFVLDGDAELGYPGVRGFFAMLERKKYKLHVRVFLSKYRGYALCPECKGQRLRAEARAVLIGGKNICEVCALSITDAMEFFSGLKLTAQQEEIAGKVLHEVKQRLSFLHEVGLDYLTLDRLSSTLSGGEAQRIQLATSLGSRLVGALYVLDEPSIGLHPRDTAKLIHILHELRDLGNTILVVEHDPEVVRSADRLLDMGPGAGELGGRLMAAGTVAQIRRDPNSLTGKYLSGKLSIPVPKQRRQPGRDWLRLKGARGHNLRGPKLDGIYQGVDLEFPLGQLVAVTGVSGSGKSTLVHDVLHRALMNELDPGSATGTPPVFRELIGAGLLNDAVMVDQSPIGRTPRSNPVTYIKAFDAIRDLYAAQPDARRRGYAAGTFSFNVPGGRCDVCEGDGVVTVEMQFLADVELPCEECSGTRYKQKVLEIKYKGRSIYDVLNMTVKEAITHFAGFPKIVNKLQVLDEVGLGYVRLGQSATTLSGGEAQRVKLAAHLAAVRADSGSPRMAALRHQADVINARNPGTHRLQSRILYILDEPTTGLHFDDVNTLLAAFRKLIESGGSLLVIEHNLDVIKSADYVIDLGPEGGVGGGMVVAAGTPEEIAATPGSHTGQWLRTVLTKD